MSSLAGTEAPTDAAPPEGKDEKRRCGHCGNLFQPRFEEERFCCSGCRVVHDLIQSGGFGSFYDLLGRRLLQPANAAEPPADEMEELGEAIAEAEESRADEGGAATLRLRVGNLSCTACVWLIDHLFRKHEGALKSQADTTRSLLTLWWAPGEFDALEFVRDLHRYGYPARLVDDSGDDDLAESRGLLTRLGVTGGLALNTMVFTLPSYLGLETSDDLSRLFTLISFASATLALAVGGSYFFQRAASAWRAGALHMDLPISLGLAAAWLGSVGGLVFGIEEMLYFDFVATFAFLMLGGRWLHLRLLERNRRQLRARDREITSTFRLGEDGERERIPVSSIAEGDLLEIAGAAMIPVEGQLEEEARFHLDWINGEPDPLAFRRGQIVPAGARNAHPSPVRVRAREAFAGSSLEKLLTGERDDTATAAAHPVLKHYLVTVVLVAVAGGIAWTMSGAGLSRSLQVFISVLVVSCPCALGLALPLLDEMLLARMKRHGLFVRRHSLWRKLGDITTLAFDKTGTLTEPIKRLANEAALDGLDEDTLRALRHLTATNHHPAGRALHEALTARFGLPREDCRGEFTETPGSGVSTTITGAEWRLGRGDWACSGNGGTTCTLSRDGKAVASFPLEEAVRDGAREQLARLRAAGYRISILSGDPDRARVVETAARLGIAEDEVHSDLSPAGKAERIREGDGPGTLFVGDGGNDSLAFDAAGVAGTPATGIRAIESRADFVFTGRGFHALGLLLDAARRRRLLVGVIFATALLYNVVAVSVCLAGHMNPLLAAVLMPLSSIVTTAIAARA